jgi:hypothetical protein
MNPYLEDPDIWPDFHGTFLIELRARLNKLLPKGYVARWDRYVWVDEDQQERLLGKPDIFVSEQNVWQSEGGGTATLAAPATVILPTAQAKGKPVVRIKRQEYLQTGTNLVEIDLLRGGQRAPVEGAPTPCDYCILVSRAAEFPRAGFWPLTIRDPLPLIPIPLDPGIADVRISLQECLEPVYEQGRYDEDVDYAKTPPPPPMSEADAGWVREQVSKQAASGNGMTV